MPHREMEIFIHPQYLSTWLIMCYRSYLNIYSNFAALHDPWLWYDMYICELELYPNILIALLFILWTGPSGACTVFTDSRSPGRYGSCRPKYSRHMATSAQPTRSVCDVLGYKTYKHLRRYQEFCSYFDLYYTWFIYFVEITNTIPLVIFIVIQRWRPLRSRKQFNPIGGCKVNNSTWLSPHWLDWASCTWTVLLQSFQARNTFRACFFPPLFLLRP